MSQPYVPALEDQPRPEDIGAIRSGLEAYNRQFAPDGSFKPLVIVLRAADQSIAAVWWAAPIGDGCMWKFSGSTPAHGAGA
jgi:hypothetical protein